MSQDVSIAADTAAPRPADKLFTRKWAIVALCVWGISTGPAAFGGGAIGVFIETFQNTFGWSRGEISSAVSFSMYCTVLSAPIIGALVDRYGALKILAPSLVALGLCMIAITFIRDVWNLQMIYIAIGTLAAGSNSVAYMRVLASWFDRHRGLAIGIAGSGTGLGFAYVPIFTEHLKESYGWTFGYYGLAALALLVSLPLMLIFLRERPANLSDPYEDGARKDDTGVDIKQAIRGRDFWVLAGMFMCVSGVLYGLISHLVPLLTDKGLTGGEAAKIASLFGLAAFGGRILIGFLVDRFDARRVALIFFLFSAIGIPLLAADLPTTSLYVVAVLLGGSLGAEVDMLAYLTSRYFGLRCFAQNFGVLFGAVMLAMGTGPFLFGAIYDATGSYNAMLIAAAPICAFAALLTLALHPYQTRQGNPIA